MYTGTSYGLCVAPFAVLCPCCVSQPCHIGLRPLWAPADGTRASARLAGQRSGPHHGAAAWAPACYALPGATAVAAAGLIVQASWEPQGRLCKRRRGRAGPGSPEVARRGSPVTARRGTPAPCGCLPVQVFHITYIIRICVACGARGLGAGAMNCFRLSSATDPRASHARSG
mgnify:CR=1 FL=1